jgi:hypothetical protein
VTDLAVVVKMPWRMNSPDLLDISFKSPPVAGSCSSCSPWWYGSWQPLTCEATTQTIPPEPLQPRQHQSATVPTRSIGLVTSRPRRSSRALQVDVVSGNGADAGTHSGTDFSAIMDSGANAGTEQALNSADVSSIAADSAKASASEQRDVVTASCPRPSCLIRPTLSPRRPPLPLSSRSSLR